MCMEVALKQPLWLTISLVERPHTWREIRAFTQALTSLEVRKMVNYDAGIEKDYYRENILLSYLIYDDWFPKNAQFITIK